MRIKTRNLSNASNDNELFAVVTEHNGGNATSESAVYVPRVGAQTRGRRASDAGEKSPDEDVLFG